MESSLTSLALPSQLLKSAFFAGAVPFRACTVDPRCSYGLYIPLQHYTAIHDSLRKGVQPEKLLPLVVTIHGTKRDASRSRDQLIPFADTNGVAVLAPMFPAGLDGTRDIDSYKLLRTKTLHADTVLLGMLDDVKKIWPGIDIDQFSCVGYSGGAQFALRFAYIHASRLHALAIGAPGRVTQISSDPWPKGTGDLESVFEGRKLDLDALKRIPHILFAVGENDSAVVEAARMRGWLSKQSAATIAGLYDTITDAVEDSADRVTALYSLRQNWLEHGISSDLEVVPGVAHDSAQVIPVIADWLAVQVPKAGQAS